MRTGPAVALLLVCGIIAGCGSGNSASTGSSSAANAAAGQAAATPATGDCPITESHVNKAFGQAVPSIDAHGFICQFSTTKKNQNTDPYALLSAPGIQVSAFPIPGTKSKTLGEARKELEGIADLGGSAEEQAATVGKFFDEPGWARDAFMQVTTHPANETAPSEQIASLYLPLYEVEVVVPDGGPRSVREGGQVIGDTIAQQ